MGYIRVEFEIQEDEYTKLMEARENNVKAFHDMIEEIAYRSMFKPHAYGCDLPMNVFESCGKYYATWNRYDSCD